jgi:hypothetical protein
MHDHSVTLIAVHIHNVTPFAPTLICNLDSSRHPHKVILYPTPKSMPVSALDYISGSHVGQH